LIGWPLPFGEEAKPGDRGLDRRDDEADELIECFTQPCIKLAACLFFETEYPEAVFPEAL